MQVIVSSPAPFYSPEDEENAYHGICRVFPDTVMTAPAWRHFRFVIFWTLSTPILPKRSLSTTRVAQLQAAPVACVGCGSWCGLDYCEAITGIKGQKKKTTVVYTLARMEITADFFFEKGNQTAWFSLMDSLGFERSKVKIKDTSCLPHDHRCVQNSQFYFADRFFAIPERFFGH